MFRCPVTNQLLLEPQTVAAPLIANEAFYRFEALIRVEDSTLTAPPAGPHSTGRPFLILSTSPTGAWTAMGSCLVIWLANHWHVMAPIGGMRTYCAATHRKFEYNDTVGKWLVVHGAKDLGSFSSGTVSLDGAQGTFFEFNVTGSVALDTVVATTRPGRIYFCFIKNTSGSSRTVTFSSGHWIHTVTSVVVTNNQGYLIKFSRQYSGNRNVVLSARQNVLS